jgi:hypothetical protein
MNGILKNVRPTDYLIAAVMTIAGVFLMWENVHLGDEALAHPTSTTTWWMLPAFVPVTLPVLWRRRHVLAVVAVTTLATAGHVLAFGWLTRCGVALPLSFALAYAVARFAGGKRDHLLGLAGILVFHLVTLVRDSSTGGLPHGLELAIPLTAVFYGIGLLVQNRVTKKHAVTTGARQPERV